MADWAALARAPETVRAEMKHSRASANESEFLLFPTRARSAMRNDSGWSIRVQRGDSAFPGVNLNQMLMRVSRRSA
jgi:hypothetical protein